MSIRSMVDAVARCTICQETMAKGCKCWAKCKLCGWSYRNLKGEKCRNPVHRKARRTAAVEKP